MRVSPALALLCLLPLTANAEGEIYRWRDSAGVWHYSDQPQPGAELVKAARKPASATPAPPPAARSATPPPANAPLPAVSDAVAQQVRQEAESARSEQCKKATDDYDRSLRARRLYRMDEQGNQVFLSDAEIDQARLQARSTRDLACGPQ